MAKHSDAPTCSFWSLVSIGILALSSCYAALVMLSANWVATQRLRNLYPDDEQYIHTQPYDGMPIRAFLALAWERAQGAFVAGALLLLLLWFWLGPARPAGRTELRRLGVAMHQAGRQVWQAWSSLPAYQRWLFEAHLLLLTLVRFALSWTLMWSDDATSYHLFVRNGLLAVGAYYPIPNNHELSNLLSLGFYQLHASFWWSMRLPVLLTSTAATVVFFRVLLRRLGYWPALLAAGAASWLSPALYYAASGRGYWLVLLLTGFLFWALLALLDPPGPGWRARVAWLVLMGAGVLGMYAIPSFAYVLVSAWSWLGWQALWRRQWALLGRATVAGLVVLVGTIICYSPTLYVSGWQALGNNPYLRSTTSYWPYAPSWQTLPSYVWHVEGYLGGQYHLGAFVMVLALGTFCWRAWQARTGHLPEQRQQAQQVGWPALWFMLSMYLAAPAQPVFPPERVWLYKAWFGFVLLAISVASWRWTGAKRWALGMGILVFVLYQVRSVLVDNRNTWLFFTGHEREFNWFAQHNDVLYTGARKDAPLPSPAGDAPAARKRTGNLTSPKPEAAHP